MVEKQKGWQAALLAISGPAAWALVLYRSLCSLRHRVLRRFGVQGYSCCCSHHGARGTACGSTTRTADRLANHPSVP